MTTASTPHLRLAIIIGSTREGRFADVIANWFVALARGRDQFELDVIDLATAELPVRFSHAPSPGLATFLARLDRADAFVVVTPEYNHSYPASLKHAIDFANAEWARKPVAFVSYGGISGGLRAVEHLRNVYAEVRATTIRETLSFAGPWSQFDADGALAQPAAAEMAADALLDDLAWWAHALHAARHVDAAAAREAAEAAR